MDNVIIFSSYTRIANDIERRDEYPEWQPTHNVVFVNPHHVLCVCVYYVCSFTYDNNEIAMRIQLSTYISRTYSR